MTAEFNFLGNSSSSSSNPRFFLHFKPRFGDFSVKKSQSSSISSTQIGSWGRTGVSGVFEEEDSSLEVVEKPSDDGFLSVGTAVAGGNKLAALPLRSSLDSAVSGMELGAKTQLPIRNGAVLKLRWGVKFPEGFQRLLKKNPTAGISTHGIPLLVLNKIGIEHVAKEDKKVGPNHEVGSLGSSADLAETCFTVKRQLETLRSENAQLGKALDDLKVEFGNKGFKIREGQGGDRKSVEVKEGDNIGGKLDF